MRVLITGATGYMGRALAITLLQRGHEVRGLVRPASAGRLPVGVESATGDALRAPDVEMAMRGRDTVVHLVGTPRPAPWKARQFEEVDEPSLRAAADAASATGARVVYVSVAHPAPVMRSYIAVRQRCEQLLAERGLQGAILRPWYVLGPGHRWPYVLLPGYWLAERVAAMREPALRLGLVSHREMVLALVAAVETARSGLRVIEVPEIRSSAAAVAAAVAAARA